MNRSIIAQAAPLPDSTDDGSLRSASPGKHETFGTQQASGNATAVPRHKRSSAYHQILKSSALIAGSSAINMAIGLVRTKAVAMLLGPAGFGLMGAFSTVSDLSRMIATLGVNNSGVRQIAEAAGTQDIARISHTVTALRRVTLVLGATGGVLLAALSKPVAILTFGDNAHAPAIALLGLAVLLQVIADGQGALLQGMRRIGDIALMSVIGALIGAVLTIGFIFWLRERGIAIGLVAGAGASLGISWWYSRRVKIERIKLSLDSLSREAYALLRLGLAFMMSGLLTMGAAYAVRVILIRSEGLEGAGYFQAAWAVGGFSVGFILQALATDFYPRLVAASTDDVECNRLVNEQATVSLLIAGIGVMGTLTLAPLAITVLFSANFAAATDVLRWICLGMALRVVTWPLGTILIAKNKRAWFVTADLLWAIVYIGLTCLGIAWFGLVGAGFAFFGAYVFHFFVVYPMCRRVSGFRWSRNTARIAVAFVLTISAVQMGFILLPPTPSLVFGIAATVLSTGTSLFLLTRLVSPGQCGLRWLATMIAKRQKQ